MRNELNKGNRWLAQLGIKQEGDPFVAFEKKPCAETLSRIEKQAQI